ncbi:MAG: N-acetylmuramoyl-L-alanine amidase [Kiritimatiellae bacterium]|nr:N-acetylmuramoyl-L-alanine amidase [Kiritimatiellia bacterium]
MLLNGTRRTLSGMVLVLVVALLPLTGRAISVSTRFRSPRNPERKVRRSTELIVLHTTEAPARSSLNKLSDRGEAHFCVTEIGSIYQIVDRDREAFHAGRSMWQGREDVDKFSIGIECVGYHDKPMPQIQLLAIRDLVKELKRMYRIPDERVLCHSHVAYGSPNKWQRRRHRGRKRCGMLFAMPTVRRILELYAKPAFDADTRAGRLAVGDDYLRRVLYGGVDTMIGKYGNPAPAPAEHPVIAARAPPPPKPKPSAADGKKTASSATPVTIAQLQAKGFTVRGTVTKTVTASRIAGARWNSADTYYTIRGKVIPGTAVDAAHMETGMRVWMKK